jgi:hypothetical protein
MKERPILFSGEMVRAILDGRKTQTRRVVKGAVQTHDLLTTSSASAEIGVRADDGSLVHGGRFACPYGIPGDRLWVKETWRKRYADAEQYPEDGIQYKADGMYVAEPVWRPSRYMPRWASRILLEITDVRVERVQGISYEDILAEGWNVRRDKPWTDGAAGEDARAWFCELWDSINAKKGYGWDTDPWVFVIEFRRINP